MEYVYTWCAALGGLLLATQTALLLIGLDGGDVEVEVDADAVDSSTSFVAVFSLRAIVSFMTFFGLAGLACVHARVPTVFAVPIAVAAGAFALLTVAWVMHRLARLQSRGNVDLDNAVGAEGTVYLRVPARRGGVGRVHVDVQGRRIECRAVTTGPELPTGATVVVLAVPSRTTVEVEGAGEPVLAAATDPHNHGEGES